jgi:hypothetical protein
MNERNALEALTLLARSQVANSSSGSSSLLMKHHGFFWGRGLHIFIGDPRV